MGSDSDREFAEDCRSSEYYEELHASEREVFQQRTLVPPSNVDQPQRYGSRDDECCLQRRKTQRICARERERGAREQPRERPRDSGARKQCSGKQW